MALNYRLKIPKDAIKVKDSRDLTLPELPTRSEKPQLNYLTEYYADSLYTKEARILADKLTDILKRTNQTQMVQKDSLELKSISRENLSAEEFQKTLQLENIYGYESEYFKSKKRRHFKYNLFLGSTTYQVRKKTVRSPKSTVRQKKFRLDMLRAHLALYHERGDIVSFDPQTDEVSFTPSNPNSPQSKLARKNANKLEGYLNVRLTRRNILLTLTDVEGNCIVTKSGGSGGFLRRQRQNAFASRQLAREVADIAMNKNYKKITIIFTPFNRIQRWRIKPIMQTLERRGLLIMRVQRKIVQPHGGCRKKKSRRL